ncbi:MAG TPA: ATPase, T2SS/T4P/T4SS family [bacterium]|nr:ATPase, T2SS/T4P/T4SS family [bacterium]
METKIISFFSTKGGVGKTTLSLNVAVSLAAEGKKVLLVDMDFSGPQDMAKMLDVPANKSMINIISSWEEVKTEKENIKKYVTHTNLDNLHLLSSILHPREVGKITSESVRDIFDLLRENAIYDFIVVDAGRDFTDHLIRIFDSSNLIFLVVTPDVLSVYQTEWFLDTFQSLHFPLKMLKMVLNRAESKGGVSWQEIKLLFPLEIFAKIPSEGQVVGLALNRGKPVVLDSKRSRISESIRDLALQLINSEDIYIQHTELSKLRVTKDSVDYSSYDFWTRIGLIEPSGSAIGLEAKTEDDEIIKIKKRIHKRLIEEMDLKRMPVEILTADYQKMKSLKDRAEKIVSNLLTQEAGAFLSSFEVRQRFIKEIIDEALGLGPLEDLIKDSAVTEIMVNNKDFVYVEKEGKIELTSKKFTTNDQVRIVVERILAPLGRRIDESNPYVDARLPDGSRVNAIISPLSLTGPTLTIRKFSRQRLGMEELISRYASLTPEIAEFLKGSVVARKNILVSGGTGSGKTTFLNILSHNIPEHERIITIEDSAELKLNQIHWIRLESKPPNIEGKGEIAIRDLFRNTLRMRPDRIIVGEVRGQEVLDMLQAMNTGHDGSMSTIHANSTQDVLIRLDSMLLMSEVELPIRAIREMISSAIDLIVHTARLSDGSRKVLQVTEVAGMLDDTHVNLQDIFIYHQTGLEADGRVKGYFTPTGYIPSFYEDMKAKGISLSKEIFMPKD